MFEFFEKNWRFLIFITCFGSLVLYSINRDRKKSEKLQSRDMQKGIDESQKDTKGGLEK
jgi:hypothetical protein